MLINIFVKGFYKKYAKLFFFSFCLFASYFLFIQIAGVYLSHTRDFWTLFISLQFATEPIFILLFGILSLWYMILSFSYLKKELNTKKLDFLKYTFFTNGTSSRYKTWLVIVALINLPVLFYSFYSFIIGFIVLNKFTGAYTVLYVIFLCLLSIVGLDFLGKKPISDKKFINNLVLSLNLNWFSTIINLANLFKNKLLAVIAVKAFCILTMIIIANYMEINTHELNFKILFFTALTIASFTTIILYNDFLFEGNRLMFSLNFPISKIGRFLKAIPFFLILMIPEEIVSFIQFDFIASIIFIITLLVFLLIIRSGIFAVGNRPMLILKILTIFYFITLLLLLYNLFYLILIISIMFALILFMKNYKFEALKGNDEN